MNPITPGELDAMPSKPLTLAQVQTTVINTLKKNKWLFDDEPYHDAESLASAGICIAYSLGCDHALREQAAELRELRFTVSAHENRLQAYQQAGAWVPVAERLPEVVSKINLTTCLLWVQPPQGKGYITSGFLDMDGFRGNYGYVNHVTHWQPLPAGPVRQQEGGEGNG